MRGDYTPGAGGALTGAESALSSLPLCPCRPEAPTGPAPLADHGPCGARAHRVAGHSRDLECSAGHVYRGTPEELADAEGAERAARRRAPVTTAWAGALDELFEWEDGQ